MGTETSRRERKVVTVVFCDLVGFTSRAEAMDPEDVEALLRPYHERVREELERHGGTVEKFIGDAVMALFGAPTAHEDDPERAVRAAVAIRDFALEEGLELRVGITTGEALVSLDARPDVGEGMASGDVVNTAARLQSAAPVNGVIVDETTYRATRHTIDYADVEPVEAKGKAEPITVWKAMHAHSRFGVDVAHEARATLVGRERELTAVRETFERARHDRSPQLLTLVGVPGIGKSRLVYELSRIADADEELITWRQGRCLAYGDGITLWALGEIVKAQAGVVEQDPPDEVAAKIRGAVEEVLAGSGDEAWVASHVLALVGQGGEAELGGDRRAEAFAAWRRFLEALAEQRPLVVVFEDIHWADELLLDFVDELVDWVTDVPLLAVCTARPELLERRPDWSGGKLNATTLALQPLSDEQTATLLSELLGRPVLAAESQQTLLERAGGNPLYAEQFADLFVERGSAEQLPLPETLQGVIAARLDGLPPGEKDLLQDAAVVGKVFWVSALREDPAAVQAPLHALVRKGFVRRQKRSSLEGESELAFAHALVRDVAYGQIARADRAAKHRRTAEWIESLGRTEDHAEMRAYHWMSTLELARATGQEDSELAARARLALRDAGDRASALNSYEVAALQYEEALALWPHDAADRADLLFRRARALYEAYDGRREEALLETLDALLAAGEKDLAAETEAFLSLCAWYGGDGEAQRLHLARAEELAENSVSPSAARVLTVLARSRALRGDAEDGLRLGRAAYAMTEEFGLEELRAHALSTIALSKRDLDDPTASEDMERALELAVDLNSPVAAGIMNNRAVDAVIDGEIGRSDELYAESIRLAERFGNRQAARFTRANYAWSSFACGRWEEALSHAEALIAECEAGFAHAIEHGLHMVRGRIRSARGDPEGALKDHLLAIDLARMKEDDVQVVGALALAAATLVMQGSLEDARARADEAIRLTRTAGLHGVIFVLTPFADVLDIGEDLRDAVEVAPGPRAERWRRAILLALDEDFRGAADVFASTGGVTFEAEMRLEAGERLIEEGRRAEGEVELRQAIAFAQSVGATAYLSRAEELLAKTA